MNTIILACGHNLAKDSPAAAPDRGASGNGRTEYDVTRALVTEIVRRGIPGFRIVVAPEGMGIVERCKFVNETPGAKMLMEFHLDAATESASGCSTWHVSGNDWAANEARQFQAEYTRVTGLRGRGVRGDQENRHGRLGAIRDVKIFALLVELGFITNAGDLRTVIAKGADGVIAGIAKMFRDN